MELCEVFARCGLDVALISAANAVFSLVLRRAAKKLKPNARTVLGYLFGTVVYAVYASAAAGDAAYAFENFAAVAQKGLTAGTLSLLICAAFDRFTGGGSGAESDVAATELLLESVPEENRRACAEEILRLAGTLSGEELDGAVKTAIAEHGGECDGVTEFLAARTALRLVAAKCTQ